MAKKFIESAILLASMHNLKNHSNGVNYKTRPFAKVHGSLMSKIARNCKFYDLS